MAVRTGTTYSFRENIVFDYACSRCGTQNAGRDTLETEVFTSALIRVNPREEANSYFESKIKSLNKGPIPERYSDTALFCKCAKCGNMEPWSTPLPKRVSPHWLWLMAVTLIVGVAAAIPPGLPKLLCVLSGAIPYLALTVRNLIKRSKRLKAIRALPAQSLPVVRPAPAAPTAPSNPLNFRF